MYEIKVPATSANIGPGFDSLGVALKLYNQIIFKEGEKEVEIQGVEEKYANKNNLIYQSFRKTEKYFNLDSKKIMINIKTNIPVSRGLGSSAACVVAGVAGAFKIHNLEIDDEEILKISTQIEGHPDNVAPCIYGGLTASFSTDKKIFTEKYNVSKKIYFYALIPNFELSTLDSRRILPKSVEYKDAVFNLSRIPFLIKGLTSGNIDIIKEAIIDRLHQPYREKLIEEYRNLKKIFSDLDISYYLSGAGPTIMCISDKNNLIDPLKTKTRDLKTKWIVKQIKVDNKGYNIRRLKV
jgi:homoserine kinase